MIESTLILDRIITSIMTLYFIAIAIWIIWLLLIAISNITKKIKKMDSVKIIIICMCIYLIITIGSTIIVSYVY